MNLEELTNELTKANVQKTDQLTAKYIEESVKHITQRGDKIEDYTLALISNLMELGKDGSTVTMQYRIIRIDELTSLPTVKGEL